jgi:hypothetical protein
VLERGKLAIQDLSTRPESVIFVVSHSGFLRTAITGRFFFNSDYRVYNFADGDGDVLERLQQDESTILGGLKLSSDDSFELGAGLPDTTVAL